MVGVVRVREPLLNPSNHKFKFRGFNAENIRDDLVHLERTLFNDLMPVHNANLLRQAIILQSSSKVR